ncbi:MAG: hypothetical protein IT165_25225 [Bryobacterales bacterium]|nr:hypothetical protein [Bryobacterales bacterium]
MKTATANKRKQQAATPGFAIKLTANTDLGLATLIVEDEDGHYEPLGVVATIGEGRDEARDDWRRRIRQPEHDRLCPYIYKIWARGLDGEHRVAAEFLAIEL